MTAPRAASHPRLCPKAILPALAFLVLLALAPSGVEASVPPPDDAVVATVEGQTITAVEFAREAAKHAPDGPGTMSLEQRRDVLAGLLDQELVYIEASRKGFGNSDEPAVRRTIVKEFLRSEVYSGVRNSDFGDDQLREYYEAHRAEFVVPAKRQIQLVTLKFGADRSEEGTRVELAKLREQLVAAPDTWHAVAQERSQDQYGTRGGDAGFVSRSGTAGLDPALVEAGFTLEVGQVSEPIRLAGAWTLVRVRSAREEVARGFEDMRGSILRRVKAVATDERYRAFVAELRKKAKVQVDSEVLKSVPVGGGPAPPDAEGEGEMGASEEP